MRGYFIVGSKNTVSIKLAKDYKPEGTERLTLTLDKSGTASSVDILDFTSTTTSTSTSTSTSSTSTTSTSTTSSTTTAAPGSSSTTTTTTGAPTGTSSSTSTTSSTTTTTTAGPTEGILGIAALSGDPALVLQSPGVYLVPEGQTFNITLSARGIGVSLNQSVPFSLSGTGLTTSDLSPGTLTGSFTLDTISNGYFVGTKTFTAIADITTEGDETVTLSITSGILQSPTTNLVFVIQDTSQTGGTTTSTSTSTSTTSTSTTSTSTSTSSTTSTSTSTSSTTSTTTAGPTSSTTTTTSTSTTTTAPTAPTMTITASKTSLIAGESATVTFTVSGSTSDFTLADVTMLYPYSSLSGFAGSGSVYTATYTPPQGILMANDISVAAGKFTVAGQNNLASNTVTFTSDTRGTTSTVQIADISYGGVQAQKVNIRFPGTSHIRYPGTSDGYEGVIFYIHGGAWGGGSKDDELPVERAIAEAGYICVNVNYRLITVTGSPAYSTNDGQWPNNANDIVEVLRLCTEPSYANRETNRVNGIDYFGIVKFYLERSAWFVGGNSAGGHLSNMGALIHGKNYNRWPDGVVNMAGPNDLWDGPDNNAAAKGLTAYHLAIVERLFTLTESNQKSASPRWYINSATWPGASSTLSAAKTQWVTVSNKYDTLSPPASMIPFHYALPPAKRRLISLFELPSSGIANVYWDTPGAYLHWYSTSGQDGLIYAANRIRNNGRYKTDSTFTCSISADVMEIDMSTGATTVTFTVTPGASPGPTVITGQPAAANWRIVNYSTSTFPNGGANPDTRLNSSTTGVAASQVATASGVVNIQDMVDNTITINLLNNISGTRYLAVELHDGTNPLAMSNTVKVIGNAASCNLVTTPQFGNGSYDDTYPQASTGGGMHIRLSNNGRWNVSGPTSNLDTGAWYTGAVNGDPALSDAYECRVTALSLNNSIGTTQVFVFGQVYYNNFALQGGATLPTAWETIVAQQVMAVNVGVANQQMEVQASATIEIRKVSNPSCIASREISLILYKGGAL